MSVFAQPMTCEKDCNCQGLSDNTTMIVLTGGPGAGKTAVLEIVRKHLCRHVVILPEAASIVFGGGFWRLDSVSAKQAAQKAIMHVQLEMENMALEEKKWAVGLCDRGVPDGLAYWMGTEESFWHAAGMSKVEAYKRYFSVIHLRSPTDDQGYNHQNPLRTESSHQAAIIDEKIYRVWSQHPHYHMVESTDNFMAKAEIAIGHIMGDLKQCCEIYAIK